MGLLGAIGGAIGLAGAKSLFDTGSGMISTKYSHDLEHGKYMRRYQDTVRDMRAAGLNPILAAQGGINVGGGTPARPMMGNTDISSGAQYIRAEAETKDTESKIADRTSQITKRKTDKLYTESMTQINKYIKDETKAKAAEANLRILAQQIQNEILTMNHNILGKDLELKEIEILNKTLRSKVTNTFNIFRNELETIVKEESIVKNLIGYIWYLISNMIKSADLVTPIKNRLNELEIESKPYQLHNKEFH